MQPEHRSSEVQPRAAIIADDRPRDLYMRLARETFMHLDLFRMLSAEGNWRCLNFLVAVSFVFGIVVSFINVFDVIVRVIVVISIGES